QKEREESTIQSEKNILLTKLEDIHSYGSQLNSILSGFTANSKERSNIEADEDINNVNKKYEKRFEAAGEDQAQIIRLEKEKEAELRKIDDKKRERDIKNAKFQKALAVTQSIIDTTNLVIRAVLKSPLPFPLSLTAGLAAGIFGLGKTAVIANRPIPKFATGTKRVLGDGTETSDSVHAMLSKNERIVDAANNRKIGFDLSNDQLATAAQMYRSLRLNGSSGIGSGELVSAINKNTTALKGRRVPHTSVHVSNGHRVINKTKYLS
ncbi:hypothetical protein KAT92_06660, partial [Candidatus Babeliales bacterium]|nr:hypothetical protein [Candidatus Babeliales bacterium]